MSGTTQIERAPALRITRLLAILVPVAVIVMRRVGSLFRGIPLLSVPPVRRVERRGPWGTAIDEGRGARWGGRKE